MSLSSEVAEIGKSTPGAVTSPPAPVLLSDRSRLADDSRRKSHRYAPTLTDLVHLPCRRLPALNRFWQPKSDYRCPTTHHTAWRTMCHTLSLRCRPANGCLPQYPATDRFIVTTTKRSSRSSCHTYRHLRVTHLFAYPDVSTKQATSCPVNESLPVVMGGIRTAEPQHQHEQDRHLIAARSPCRVVRTAGALLALSRPHRKGCGCSDVQ